MVRHSTALGNVSALDNGLSSTGQWLCGAFHRQLKASLSARLSSHNWVDQLLWVMLGIRATHKDDMGASLADIVYGTPLVLPGQFCSLAGPPPATEPFLHDLQGAMENLQPFPISAHCKATAEHVPEILQKCPMVWIWPDGCELFNEG